MGKDNNEDKALKYSNKPGWKGKGLYFIWQGLIRNEEVFLWKWERSEEN